MSSSGLSSQTRPGLMVPGERIELPTNGLQNRCSTAELTRLARHIIQIDRIVDP